MATGRVNENTLFALLYGTVKPAKIEMHPVTDQISW